MSNIFLQNIVDFFFKIRLRTHKIEWERCSIIRTVLAFGCCVDDVGVSLPAAASVRLMHFLLFSVMENKRRNKSRATENSTFPLFLIQRSCAGALTMRGSPRLHSLKI